MFSPGFDGSPGVSRDGRTIAYDVGPDDGGDQALQGIYVEPLDHGTAPVQLTRGPAGGFDTNPEISPDGTAVAFQRFQASRCSTRRGCGPHEDRGARSSIWVVGIDGGAPRRITDPGRVWSDPHWAPDGSRLVIQSYDEGGTLHGISSDLWDDPARRDRARRDHTHA